MRSDGSPSKSKNFVESILYNLTRFYVQSSFEYEDTYIYNNPLRSKNHLDSELPQSSKAVIAMNA